jgi:hypothetical protein
MIAEVQYKDQNGSVCAFCGRQLSVVDKCETYEHEDTMIKQYATVCPLGHLNFIVTTSVNNTHEYVFTTRQFVYYQDWEDHVDMTIQSGPWEVPLLDNEDDAWLVHLTALKALNKIPEPKEIDDVESD